MLELMAPYCMSSRKDAAVPLKVLLIGLGGGALAQYILSQCPRGTMLEAVEYDPRMIDVATNFFGLHPQKNVFVIDQGDGGAIVEARAKDGHVYDIVFVDAFAGGPHVPESCRNLKFIKNLRRVLGSGGLVVQNIKADYQETLPLYEESFGKSSVDTVALVGNGELPSQLIVAKLPLQ
jgi:spermidine synthase